ncbi:hypothetical protein C8Q79DRAFT_905553 [Trametes meyenii]|nr:hypothetical protein C8Q79DRAFT_905553 [Trametes meyenii]
MVAQEVAARRQKIIGLREEIAQLRTVHNLIAPINALPPELLSMIYSYADSSSIKNTNIINITHVCRHWRDIALRTPSLWARVGLGHPIGFKAFLERSKALPLQITLATRPQISILNTLGLIVAEHARIRTLDVRIGALWVAINITFRTLFLPTPKLEELSIEMVADPGARLYLDQLRAPTDFDGAPSLRSITLREAPLPYLPKGPNALTKVSLTGQLPTLHTLVDLLVRSPLLEVLDLSGSFDHMETSADLRKVALAHLRTLEIEGDPPQNFQSLLRCLVLPKGTDITISTRLSMGEDFSFVVPAYNSPTPLEFGTLQGLRRLELIWGPGSMSLLAYRNADEFLSPALDIQADADHYTTGRRFFGDWPLDASRLETFVVCGSCTRSTSYDRTVVAREPWAVMLEALPALKTLRLMSLSRTTLIPCVQEITKHRTSPLFPGLETIEIFDVAMPDASWVRLQEFVMARSPAAGGSLKRVELFNVDAHVWGPPMPSEIRRVGVKLAINEDEGSDDDMEGAEMKDVTEEGKGA